jgi:hypothetical protein
MFRHCGGHHFSNKGGAANGPEVLFGQTLPAVCLMTFSGSIFQH